jgi:hypothetical protein
MTMDFAGALVSSLPSRLAQLHGRPSVEDPDKWMGALGDRKREQWEKARRMELDSLDEDAYAARAVETLPEHLRTLLALQRTDGMFDLTKAFCKCVLGTPDLARVPECPVPVSPDKWATALGCIFLRHQPVQFHVALSRSIDRAYGAVQGANKLLHAARIALPPRGLADRLDTESLKDGMWREAAVTIISEQGYRALLPPQHQPEPVDEPADESKSSSRAVEPLPLTAKVALLPYSKPPMGAAKPVLGETASSVEAMMAASLKGDATITSANPYSETYSTIMRQEVERRLMDSIEKELDTAARTLLPSRRQTKRQRLKSAEQSQRRAEWEMAPHLVGELPFRVGDEVEVFWRRPVVSMDTPPSFRVLKAIPLSEAKRAGWHPANPGEATMHHPVLALVESVPLAPTVGSGSRAETLYAKQSSSASFDPSKKPWSASRILAGAENKSLLVVGFPAKIVQIGPLNGMVSVEFLDGRREREDRVPKKNVFRDGQPRLGFVPGRGGKTDRLLLTKWDALKELWRWEGLDGTGAREPDTPPPSERGEEDEGVTLSVRSEGTESLGPSRLPTSARPGVHDHVPTYKSERERLLETEHMWRNFSKPLFDASTVLVHTIHQPVTPRNRAERIAALEAEIRRRARQDRFREDDLEATEGGGESWGPVQHKMPQTAQSSLVVTAAPEPSGETEPMSPQRATLLLHKAYGVKLPSIAHRKKIQPASPGPTVVGDGSLRHLEGDESIAISVGAPDAPGGNDPSIADLAREPRGVVPLPGKTVAFSRLPEATVSRALTSIDAAFDTAQSTLLPSRTLPATPPDVPPGLVEAVLTVERQQAEVMELARAGSRSWRRAANEKERHRAFMACARAMRQYRLSVLDVMPRIRKWQGLPSRPQWDVDQPAETLADEQQALVEASTAECAEKSPFIWRGRLFALWVIESLDGLSEFSELRSWLGGEFPLRRNPLSLPNSLDTRPPPLRASLRIVKVAGSAETRMDASLAQSRAGAERMRKRWWDSFRPAPQPTSAEELLRLAAERQTGATGAYGDRIQAGLTKQLNRAQNVAGRFSQARDSAHVTSQAISEVANATRNPWSMYPPVATPGSPLASPAVSSHRPPSRPLLEADIPLTEDGGAMPPRRVQVPPLWGEPQAVGESHYVGGEMHASIDPRDLTSISKLRSAPALAMTKQHGQSEVSKDAERTWASRAALAGYDGTTHAGTDIVSDAEIERPLEDASTSGGVPSWWPCFKISRREILESRVVEGCLIDAEILRL